MNSNDVLALVKAGFTKEEIAQMAKAESANTHAKTEEKKEEQRTETKTETVNTTLEEKFDALMEKLNGMNFLGASQPNEETVDDIIANIINPPEQFPGNNEGGM